MRRTLVLVTAVGLTIAVVGILIVKLDRSQDSLAAARLRISVLQDRVGDAVDAADRSQESAGRMKQRAGRFRIARNQARRLSWRLQDRLSEISCFADDNRPGRPGFVRGSLRGDIDGDGIDDLARLVGTTAGGRGCSYTLEVATQSGPATTEIDVDSWGGKQMTPLLLAQIDASPGLEIVVEIGRGASSESAQIFSMSEQSLHPLTFSDEPDPNFTFSGSVCCGGAIDCLPGQSGQIVLSSYGYNKSADGYVVTRRFYQVQGSAFELMDSQTYRGGFKLDRFPEFRGSDYPFQSCTDRIPRAKIG